MYFIAVLNSLIIRFVFRICKTCMNSSVLKYYLIVAIFGLPSRPNAQHLYLGLGYSSMDPKNTIQAAYYLEGYKPRLELENAINAQYEKRLGKKLGLSLYVSYVYNTNKNVLWINPKYHPQINPLQLPLRYSFNNVSHLLSTGASVNVDLVNIKKTAFGLSPYFNARFLFKKQTQPVNFDDFKFATHKFKPFNLEAYPLLYSRINRFLIQLGARIYSLKYFDEIVELRYGEFKPGPDKSNPLKWVVSIGYRL